MYHDIPLITSVDIEDFTGATIEGGASLRNLIIEQYTDGRPYVTQRPALNIAEDASSTVAKVKGRGIFFWEDGNNIYFCNDDTLYKGSYGASVGTVSSGREPGTFLELASKLIFLDHENGEGWTVTTGDTLTQISDGDFPTTLAGGGVVLDGYLFVMDDDGIIYNSDINDAEAWNALNFITSEREEDAGIYLTKHKDHVVAFGSKTIEFFYNAGNPTGSPLTRRSDLAYRVGVLDKNSVWNSGEKIFFLGVGATGDIGLYVMDNFQIQEVSDPSISRWITYQTVFNSQKFIVSGNKLNNHEYCHVTMMNDSASVYTPRNTLVYDASFGYWTHFDSAHLYTTVAIPLMGWTNRSGGVIRKGQGILENGDIIEYANDIAPTDKTGNVDYVTEGYVDLEYFESVSTSITAIPIEIRTPEFDAGHMHNKFMHKLELVGHRIANSTGTKDMDISWSDDHYNSFQPVRRLNIKKNRSKIHRLGQFNRRAFKLEYNGVDRLRMERLGVMTGESRYA